MPAMQGKSRAPFYAEAARANGIAGLIETPLRISLNFVDGILIFVKMIQFVSFFDTQPLNCPYIRLTYLSKNHAILNLLVQRSPRDGQASMAVSRGFFCWRKGGEMLEFGRIRHEQRRRSLHGWKGSPRQHGLGHTASAIVRNEKFEEVMTL